MHLFFLFVVVLFVSLPFRLTSSVNLVAKLTQSSDPHLLEVRLHNHFARSVALLRWDLPFDERFGGVDPFNVSFANRPVAYTGVRVKYDEPTREDYLFLSSNTSLSVNVDVRALYDTTQRGTYMVSLHCTLFDIVFEEEFESLPRRRDQFANLYIISNTVAYFVDGMTKPKLSSGATYPCSTSELNTIELAKSDFETLINGASKAIEVGNSASYVEWFGVYTSARWTTASGIIKRAMDNTVVNFACDSKKSIYAYVYPSDPSHTIYLCDVFWSSHVIGYYDTQAGTIFHELSHFNDIGETDDWAYGTTNARNLAAKDPAKAINNADNYEYFAESQSLNP